MTHSLRTGEESSSKHTPSISKHIDNKTLSERIYRKTFEVIDRPLVPFEQKPKYRIRRGHTTVIRRANGTMRHLYQTGHRDEVTVDDLDQAIFFCVGGDYRTLKRYRGFDIHSKGNAVDPPRLIKHVPGYLERLRYIERSGNGKYRLNHYLVPLKYHYREGFVFPNEGVNHQHGKNVCVQPSDRVGVRSHGEGAIAPILTNKTNKHNTHTNRSSESNPILRDKSLPHRSKHNRLLWCSEQPKRVT